MLGGNNSGLQTPNMSTAKKQNTLPSKSADPPLRQKSLMAFFTKSPATPVSQRVAASEIGSSPICSSPALPTPTAGNDLHFNVDSPTVLSRARPEVNGNLQGTSSALTRPQPPRFNLATARDEQQETVRQPKRLQKRVRYTETSDHDGEGATDSARPAQRRARRTIVDSDDEYFEELSPAETSVGNAEDMEVQETEGTPLKATNLRLPVVNQTPVNNTASGLGKFKCFSAPPGAAKKARSISSPFTADEKKKERIKEFNDKNAARYQWLQDIRDADMNRPGDPGYDPRTLYVPPSAWNQFTPFEKQFWEIKSTHWDTVVFFKKGKFYELYEKDADIGHQDFDLKLTDRVNMRMVGVPESSFDHWCAQFIGRGHKVAKVEQMETALGKSLREKTGGKSKEEKVIRRELKSVLTAGTLVDESLLQTEQATYCMAIKEIEDEQSNGPTYGICFVDTATAEFKICEIKDDVERTGFETLIAQIKPRELVFEKGGLSQQSLKILKNSRTSHIMNALTPGNEFWDEEKTIDELRNSNYFSKDAGAGGRGNGKEASWPTAIQRAAKRPAMMSAMGGLISYLRSLKLDQELVTLANFSIYDPVRKNSSLVLDGSTLANLEVFANSHDGTDAGTVYKLLNKCVTPFGKRLFKLWLCHPLRSIKAINDRLDAVDALNKMHGVQEQLLEIFRRLPDMERIISRIHAGSCKLKDFLMVLEAFETSQQALLEILEPQLPNMHSSHLTELIATFPDLTNTLAWFRAAFDWELALKEGTVIPHPGVEADYDDIQNRIMEVEQNLKTHLNEQRKLLRSPKIEFRNLGKDIYQLEVPVNIKVPNDWIVISSTKNVKRYYNATIRRYIQDCKEGEELRNGILKSIKSRMYAKFDEFYAHWLASMKIVAEIDCLLALARSSVELGEPTCRPVFVEPVDGEESVLELDKLRHPCVNANVVSDFIPNDTYLGGDNANMILLTGPNMGGKSTLLRQTCVAIIMAQLGCYVPAKRCRMTPFDRIFTRIGANDNILAGQSTFMVELSETSKILQEANPRSIVILDELGRGTSTFDGYAIAYAVLHYLSTYVGCLGLFSTHYGTLTTEFEKSPNVRMMHMDCQVDSELRQVTFLYRLIDGMCPKSYGMNVASMAGVPRSIVDRAEEIARKFEQTQSIKSKSYACDRRLNLLDMSNFGYIVRSASTAATGDELLDKARVYKAMWKGLQMATPRA